MLTLLSSQFLFTPRFDRFGLFVVLHHSNHNGSTPLVLAKRRGVNKDAIRLLEGLEEQEVKGFNRGPHSKLETMQMADSER